MVTQPTAQVEWFVPGRRMGAHVLVYHQVGSTMDTAWGLAGTGASEGTAVVAHEQTHGRGRFGRPWVGEPGDSLFLSVILTPPVELAPRLSMVAGLAVARAVERLTGEPCTIKWPNDVRVRGKKVCGILIEARVDTTGAMSAVVGVGLNLDLDTRTHPELKETATSLSAITGHPVGYRPAADAVLDALDAAYAEVLAGADILVPWRRMLDTLGQRVTARWNDTEETGVAEDVADDGSLVLRRDDGTKVLLPDAEVTLQPPAP